jgi:hypothetical protein
MDTCNPKSNKRLDFLILFLNSLFICVTSILIRPWAKSIFFSFGFEELRARRQRQQKFDHTPDNEQKHTTQVIGNCDTVHRHKGNRANNHRKPGVTTKRPTQQDTPTSLRDNFPFPT